MLLSNFINNLRIELSDEAQTQYSEDTLIRACEKTVSLMSRLLPKRNIIESRILGSVTGETLTIASSTGTLAVHPVKVGSVKITGEIEGTDFSVNHLTGVVTEIGSGLPDGNYTVSYSRDPRVFDIAAVVPDCIKIERVEYPAGEEPPANPTFEPIGDFLFFKSKDFQLSETNYLRVIYLSKWTPPTVSAEGNYPSHLNNAVLIGSAGQSLIYKAEKYVQDAATALAAITPPTNYTVVKPTSPTLPNLPTAPTAPTLSFTDVDTALTAISTEITAAKAHHTSGAVVINASTRGEDVAATYGRYAEAVFGAANTRVNEAIGRLRKLEDTLQKYASQVASYGSDVNAYANQVSGMIGKYREDIDNENLGISNFSAQVNKFAADVQEKQIEATQYLDIAGRFLASGQSKINEFLVMIGIRQPEFVTTKLLSEGGA